MSQEEYKDFENTNEIWTWMEGEDGFYFQKDQLEYMVGGDTDSAMLKFPESMKFDGIEEVVKTADEIGDITNSSFPAWAKHAFNIPDDRVGVIQTDREIVADTAFFVSKKRYVAHVVNDEGEWVDKLKIMGLEVKRSDTPSAVQRYLLEVIEMILEGKSEKEVKRRVSEMKKEYTDLPIEDIARPMSCKGLRVYEKKLEETGSTLGFPYQVRAAMFYNSLCGDMDKKINAGEKILLVYIKDRREKYIAFPMDAPIPSFVKDIIIDYDTQWEKAEKKIQSYLTAMQWDAKSKREKKRMELFGF